MTIEHRLSQALLPLILALFLLALTLLTLHPAQAAPPTQPLSANVVVTTTIQAAINAANLGDTVVVPAGTYTESLTLSKAVSLTGVSSATTIIHALPNQRVLTITGATITNSVVISGLTIAGGRVMGGSGFGGGIFVTNNAQPLLQNLIITNNQAINGGGILVDFGIPVSLVKVMVISNTALNQGGGLLGGGPATLTQSRFERNIAVNGGGGGLVASDLTLTNTEFISNTAAGFGGGAGSVGSTTITGGHFEGNTSNSSGGGLYASFNLTLTNTEFLRNQAIIDGGGVYVLGPTTVFNGHFENNTAQTGNGGGLRGAGTLALVNTDFISNTAGSMGGGLTLGGITNTLMGGHFTNNRCTAISCRGGGLGTISGTLLLITNTVFMSNSAVGSGGGAYIGIPNARVINALFANNTVATTGTALFCDFPSNLAILHTTIADTILNPKAAIAVASGTVGITNTIITNHTSGISQTNGSIYEDYNLFFNVPTTSTGVVAHGTHSLNGDPKFVAPASDDYHLGSGSAALDVAFPGLVSSDFEGDPRPFGAGPDIGFDELTLGVAPKIDFYLPLILKN